MPASAISATRPSHSGSCILFMNRVVSFLAVTGTPCAESAATMFATEPSMNDMGVCSPEAIWQWQSTIIEPISSCSSIFASVYFGHLCLVHNFVAGLYEIVHGFELRDINLDTQLRNIYFEQLFKPEYQREHSDVVQPQLFLQAGLPGNFDFSKFASHARCDDLHHL